MNVLIKDALAAVSRFFADSRQRYLFLAGILVIAAGVDFFASGLARRTFVFYSVSSGKAVVENRMIRRAETRERDIARYIEEAILGPAVPDTLPLFPSGTRLRSLLLRGGEVYADFSEEAVLPPPEGGDVFTAFKTLYGGVKRNFSFVGEVKFFIMGKAAYYDEFRRLSDGTRKNLASAP